MAQAVTAENYQLKWHSHLSNLNSSVCGLYRNDKFADVVLLTSNSEHDGNGIPAHKIILSTCSYFFSAVFDSYPSLSTNPFYILLPPELTKRSMQILIQYMYTGEATVSNEILNEVLKGGEILKIRGLWRNNSGGQPPTNSSNPGYNNDQQGKAMESRNTQEFTNKPKSDKTMSHKGRSSQDRTTPLIVKASQASTNAQVTNTMPTSTQHHHPTLMVKKEMAIDPAIDKATRLKNQQPNSQQNYNMMARNETPPARISDNRPSGGRRSFDVDANNLLLLASQSGQLRITKENEQNNHHLSSRSSFVPIKESQQQNLREKQPQQHVATFTAHATTTATTTLKKLGNNESSDRNNIQIPEALNFLTIKEEPTEWHEYETAEMVGQGIAGGGKSKMTTLAPSHGQMVVKEEEEDNSLNNAPLSENEMEDEEEFHSLTCELCSETFAMPSDWVRHIESHSEVSQNLPKKRRRIEEDSDYTAALRCDLCETYFVTPAQWVRHVQNTHSETELAMANNSELPKRTIVEIQRTPTTTTSSGGNLESMKACSVCQKTFPSYASMVIHKRTHTGERPYFCTVKNCKKGFNVKSNLLRHVRTLHNNLLAGTSDNQDTNSNSD